MRVWRELGRLAAEGLAIGLVFSVLLAAAVYIVARNAPSADFASFVPAAQVALAAQ